MMSVLAETFGFSIVLILLVQVKKCPTTGLYPHHNNISFFTSTTTTAMARPASLASLEVNISMTQENNYVSRCNHQRCRNCTTCSLLTTGAGCYSVCVNCFHFQVNTHILYATSKSLVLGTEELDSQSPNVLL